MTENEHGFDPDLNYTAEDNPFWDCTDGAHPAWWRGEEYGAAGMIRLVNRWLDAPLEQLDIGTHRSEIQALKERIRDLRTKCES
jgi:hypothetical protein